MTYQLLVRGEPGDGYTAQVLEMPAVEVVAPTADQAVARARAAIVEKLSGATIVSIEVPEHPWAPLAGRYRDDPQFEEVLAQIAADREAETAAELAEWDRPGDAANEKDLR